MGCGATRESGRVGEVVTATGAGAAVGGGASTNSNSANSTLIKIKSPNSRPSSSLASPSDKALPLPASPNSAQGSPNPSAPNTAREEAVQVALGTNGQDDPPTNTTQSQTPTSSGGGLGLGGSELNTPKLLATNGSNAGGGGGGTEVAFLQRTGSIHGSSSTLKTTDVPISISRQGSSNELPPSLSRKQSVNDREVQAVTGGVQRSRTLGRRTSFGAGLLGTPSDENAWRNPTQAQELINQHLMEDPHCFRDHLAIYWRLEHVPQPPPETPTLAGMQQKLHAPIAVRPSISGANGGPTLQLRPSIIANSPAASPQSSPSASPPVPVPDQTSIYLSLGPSSGAGDKIGSSEYRPSEPSISYYPMLLPYHGLGGGDPNFSLQIQVWQKRVSSQPSGSNTSGITLTLLGYVDVSVLNMFASYEKAQGLLLKSPPPSVMGGQTPIPLQGTMLVVDYIQFYCHTTPAVTASPSRWPSALCTPNSDCLWRGQIHAIKLGVPRGCPHPNIGGSMSPANGALMLNLKEAAAILGACFLQIFRHVPVNSTPNSTPPLTSVNDMMNPQLSKWQLVHTTEFISLTRNPKFAEFQRPLADICGGSYDLPLLMQVVLSHDSIRSGELGRTMVPDSIYPDPATGVKEAVKQQGCCVCSVVHTITNMRELLAGKTKLKLHSPGSAPFPTPSTAPAQDEGRGSIFSFDGGSPLDDTTTSAAGVPIGHGTLAFNISQIFSSRASLEALARAKLVEINKTPPKDGFDELGIVRSTAYLASLLPIGRRHHRPASHLRGPSAMGGEIVPSGGSHHHGHHHGHQRGVSFSGGPGIQRSKTSGAQPNHPPVSIADQKGVSSLLAKMGIADDTANASARETLPSEHHTTARTTSVPSSASKRRSM